MSYLRTIVERLKPYTPGEQPKIAGLIKINTNENPYPPSPKVLAAIKTSVDGRLRLYPNSSAQALRERLAQIHGCEPDNILVGNGSDEILALVTRAFVEPLLRESYLPKQGLKPNSLPANPVGPSRRSAFILGRRSSTALPMEGPESTCASTIRTSDLSPSTVQFFDPSYSLYPVLAACHGARALPVPLADDFQMPSVSALRKEGTWDFRAALTFITTPNAPTGTGYATAALREICRAQKGVVLLDEAYADFADRNALILAIELPNVLVARTFSKSYALCFQRVGYVVGPKTLVGGLHKIRDSYNVNGLGQVAALATLDDLDYYRKRIRQIIASREILSRELANLDFQVYPSQTNFILVKPPRFPAQEWLARLRQKKILVRWFPFPRINQFLRISIGTEPEMEKFIRVVRSLLRSRSY